MEERESLTVYLPAGLLTEATLYKAQSESLLTREVNRRKGLSAHSRIIARREKIKQKTGTLPSSVDLIRQLRSGESQYDQACRLPNQWQSPLGSWKSSCRGF
ncbi:MAG: hypothetical protein KME01_05830 [Chroococcus sp. CMT-3BRIN-NPC107]|jgi:hypothetical protein|nr:hypothetical protein [Chroococcus sp. CMT-3BRIN-NPC107]